MVVSLKHFCMLESCLKLHLIKLIVSSSKNGYNKHLYTSHFSI